MKPDLALIPRAALIHEAHAYEAGNRKNNRTPYDWRQREVGVLAYVSAALRHLEAYLDGEDTDEDGAHHLGCVRACCGIILDAQSRGRLRDDRVR